MTPTCIGGICHICISVCTLIPVQDVLLMQVLVLCNDVMRLLGAVGHELYGYCCGTFGSIHCVYSVTPTKKMVY